jgi:hypothetical protein
LGRIRRDTNLPFHPTTRQARATCHQARLPPLQRELPKAAISSSKPLAAFDRELFQQK